MITEDEFDAVLEASADLPQAKGMYLVDDYVTNLFLTVLDFQLEGRVVERAIVRYREHGYSSACLSSALQSTTQSLPGRTQS